MFGTGLILAAAAIDWAAVVGGAVSIAVIGAVIGGLLYSDRRKSLAVRVREAAAAKHQSRAQTEQQQREEQSYKQHVTLNELAARKMDLETRILQSQAESLDHDRRAREQNEAYHRLMVQKAELEIQSLKLHIREQKKRNEDFTSYDDE